MLRVLLDENNDFPPGGPVLVDGIDSAATALRATFSTQAGEWPFDKTFGMRWRGPVLEKYFNPAATRSECATVANTVSDIEPVVGSQITIDTLTNSAARQVNITIEGVTVGEEQTDLTISTIL